MKLVTYEPFEFEMEAWALPLFRDNLTGFLHREPYAPCLLRDRDGRVYSLSVGQRHIARTWEVFTLSLATWDDVLEWHARWSPPDWVSSVSGPHRTLLERGPPRPEIPERFEPWEQAHWKTEVLKQIVFKVDDDHRLTTPDGLGYNTGRASPERLPKGLIARCEVASGLLLIGADGERLLMATDVNTMMIVTRNPAQVDEYLRDCGRVDITSYFGSTFRTAGG